MDHIDQKHIKYLVVSKGVQEQSTFWHHTRTDTVHINSFLYDAFSKIRTMIQHCDGGSMEQISAWATVLLQTFHLIVAG